MTSDFSQETRLHSDDDYFRRAALAVILIALVARLALSALLPLIADEAYAVVVSRVPSISYFDHPILGFGFARASAWLFGSEASAIVRLPHVLFAALSGWLLFLITRRAFGSRAAFWAVAWYSVAPFFLVSAGNFVVPDGPLNFFLLLTLWLVLPELLGDRPADTRRWVLAGLTLGLAMLSKYTAVLFGVAAVIVLLTSTRGRRILATPGPYLAAIVATLCLAPIVIWNVQNDWASVTFQSGRTTGGDFNPLNFLVIQLGQAGFLLPWIWAAAVYAIVKSIFSPKHPAQRIFAILAIVPILLFDLVAMFGREILPHWAMPGFLFAFPLIGLVSAGLAEKLPRLLKATFAVSLALVTALAFGAMLQIRDAALARPLGLGERADFDWTFLAWSALRDDFAERGILNDGDSYLVPGSWLIGAKAGYGVGPEVPVAKPLADPRHFAFQADPRLAGRAKGLAVIAAWPSDAESSAVELVRMAESDGYEIAGEGWTVTQTRGGKASFVVLVQPVTRRAD
ncbi:MAG: hypothetical protein Rhirs2KO_03970 [Rhizobiaceae bacterium]